VPDTDGSTTVYFGPKLPAGVKPGNWVHTMPGKGWNVILRLYSPLEPFFTKTWRPSEIALVKGLYGWRNALGQILISRNGI
jgi:hypothetical protein